MQSTLNQALNHQTGTSGMAILFNYTIVYHFSRLELPAGIFLSPERFLAVDANVKLFQGVGWNTQPSVKVMFDQEELAGRLAALRAQWEEATGGEMQRVTVDLGLLFDDLRQLIGLEGEG